MATFAVSVSTAPSTTTAVGDESAPSSGGDGLVAMGVVVVSGLVDGDDKDVDGCVCCHVHGVVTLGPDRQCRSVHNVICRSNAGNGTSSTPPPPLALSSSLL